MGNKLPGTDEDYRGIVFEVSRNWLTHFAELDWTLLKGSAVISAGMLAARGLAFLFYLILARVFTPAMYGEIQYSIVIAELFAIGSQPFGQHVLALFIGRYKESPHKLKEFFSNAWVILVCIFIVTLFIALPTLKFLSLHGLGILVVVTGTTIFYSYWGLARGFFASGRLALAYISSNLFQLILTFWLIQILEIKSVSLALIIYGGVYLLPIAVLQIVKPLPFSFDRRLVSWEVMKSILSLSLPIWFSHTLCIFTATLDILLLKYFSDAEMLGRYSLVKSITALFVFIPSGISAVLMPRVASLPVKEHQRLVNQSLGLALLINFVILAFLLLFGTALIRSFFGVDYLSSPVTILVLAIGTIFFGVHGILSAVQVGKGRANWETISRFVILITAFAAGWFLIPIYADLGAAISVFLGGLSGVIVYGVLELTKRRTLSTNIEDPKAV